MRIVQLVLACLVCKGHGYRVRMKSLQTQGSSYHNLARWHAGGEAAHRHAGPPREPARSVRVSMCTSNVSHENSTSEVKPLQDTSHALLEVQQELGLTGTSKDKLYDFWEVAESLKADVPNLLDKAPNWEIFAEDFKLIDQTGAKLEGLALNKVLLKLMRRIYKKYVREEDGIQLQFIDERDEPPAFIMAQWKVQVGDADIPVFRFWQQENPVEIEVETVFHLNDQGLVDSARIQKWLANGHHFPVKMQLWPEVLLSDNVPASLQKIKEWERSIEVLEPMQPTAVDSIRDVVPSRREFCFQIATQVGLQVALVLAVGKTGYERGRSAGLSEEQDTFDAVRNLQALIPEIFVREPDWQDFAEDFKMIDQTGVAVYGLGPNKVFLQLLRQFHNQLAFTPLKDNYSVQTELSSESTSDGTSEPVIVAKWNVKIDTRRRQLIFDPRWDFETSLEAKALDLLDQSSFPLNVSGKATFRFNSAKKVSSVNIDSWTVNGQDFKSPLQDWSSDLFYGIGTIEKQRQGTKGGRQQE